MESTKCSVRLLGRSVWLWVVLEPLCAYIIRVMTPWKPGFAIYAFSESSNLSARPRCLIGAFATQEALSDLRCFIEGTIDRSSRPIGWSMFSLSVEPLRQFFSRRVSYIMWQLTLIASCLNDYRCLFHLPIFIISVRKNILRSDRELYH